MTTATAGVRAAKAVDTESEDFEKALDEALSDAFSYYRKNLVWMSLKNALKFKKRYLDFLRHMTRHAKNVEETLEMAANNLGGMPEAQKDFFKHLDEERGHDSLARRDLKAIGESDAWEPTPAYLVLEGYVRYLAHERPLALLGFLATAEGYSFKFAGWFLSVLRKFGYSEKQTNFLKVHAEVDIGHFKELREMCLAHAKTAQHQRQILEAIKVTGKIMPHA